MDTMSRLEEVKRRMMLRSVNMQQTAENNVKFGDIATGMRYRGQAEGYAAAANLLGRYMLQIEQDNIKDIMGL